MRIGVLGPLEVVADDAPVQVGGVRLRTLLIRLALDPGRVVSAHALVEALWPDGGAREPTHALHSLVSRLRRALPDGSVLRSAPTGYLLDIAPTSVDTFRFERLAREGRTALEGGDAPLAAARLRDALALWRGDPLVDVAQTRYAGAVIARLREVRLATEEDLLAAELATGPAGPVIARLEQLTTTYPLRERLRVLLIRALQADGRPAEALTAYEAYRRLLADELGNDPGPELRKIHLMLLRGEPTAIPRQGHENARPEKSSTAERTSTAGNGGGAGVGRPARGNLPAALTSFVGRETERRRIREQLRTYRLVTLVGPGGVGKTRLAGAILADLPDPVWMVELAPVTDPDDVPQAVAASLGVRVSADLPTRLVEVLSVGEPLLVLDNCEHLVDAVARLAAELLARCPLLRVLTTSREPLNIPGEAICPVPPLDLADAVRLFTDRARSVAPDSPPDQGVAEICRRVDGLPLAIELAAARLRSMSVADLAARLDDRFTILTHGSRTALPRHRTLRAVVSWSWDLLDEAERDAAERLAVFPTTLTASAAERVGIGPDLLHALVDKSLLQFDNGRYRMLETIRAYGLERLAATGRLAAARAAYTACYLDQAERAAPHLRTAGQLPWIARLTAERENLSTALRFAVEAGDAERAVRLGAVLGQFWTIHGDHAEAASRLREALGVPGAVPEEVRLDAVTSFLLSAVLAGDLTDAAAVAGPISGTGPVAALARALLALVDGDFGAGLSAVDAHLSHPEPWTRAMLWLVRAFLLGAAGAADAGRQALTAAVAGFREAGERWGLALSLMSLAATHLSAGDFDRAVAALDETMALLRVLGTDADQRIWAAMVRIDAGDLATARDELREILDQAPSTRHIALARIGLADLARYDGDLREAKHLLELAGVDGDPAYRALYSARAGRLAVATDDLDAAARHLGQAYALALAMSDLPMVAMVGVGVADLLRRSGRPERAARVLGAAHALAGAPSARNPDVLRLSRELPAILGRTGYRTAYDHGKRLDRDRALELVGNI